MRTDPKAWEPALSHDVFLVICPECNAVVYDTSKHVEWHERMSDTIEFDSPLAGWVSRKEGKRFKNWIGKRRSLSARWDRWRAVRRGDYEGMP